MSHSFSTPDVVDRRDIDPTQDEEQWIGADVNFSDLPESQEYAGPILSQDLDGEPVTVILELPTLYSPRKYKTNATLIARRVDILNTMNEFLSRDPLPVDEFFSRRLYRDIFPRVVSKLDDLFLRVERIKVKTLEDTEIKFGYRLRIESYKEIMGTLYRLHKSLKDLVLGAGDAVPEFPTWGIRGDVKTYHLEADYEMLAVTFRTEVEVLLMTFDKHYNFLTSLPRNPEFQDFSLDIARDRTQEPVSSTSKSRDFIEPASKNNGPARPRMSGIYNLGADSISTRLHQAKQGSRAKPATAKLQNLLGTVGGQGTRNQIQNNDDHLAEPSGNFDTRRNNVGPPQISSSPAGNPSENGESGDEDENPQKGNRKGGISNPGNHKSTEGTTEFKIDTQFSTTLHVPHFDFKLKAENIPTWDGDTDTIVRWISKVNNLARLSTAIFKQLGVIVPRRLEGPAEIWYWSLPLQYRDSIEINWDTLKKAISDYYMNRKWLDKQKARAVRAFYREPKHSEETPSEYYIRKSELLHTVYSLDDSEIVLEIMEGAPANWNTILTTQLYLTAIEFQSAIRFHEDTLMRLDGHINRDRPDYKSQDRDIYAPRTLLVGAYFGMPSPRFPTDNSNISNRGFTPEEKGARPCRHCGSGKHWDDECKYSYKGNKLARRLSGNFSDEQIRAQADYDDLYYGSHSDNHSEE